MVASPFRVGGLHGDFEHLSPGAPDQNFERQRARTAPAHGHNFRHIRFIQKCALKRPLQEDIRRTSAGR